MCFSFDLRPIILVDLEELREANVEYQAAPVPIQRRKNNASPPENQYPVPLARKKLKTMCRTLMDAISCKDQNSPIFLVGDVCLKYEHIAEVINTKQKMLTINADVAIRVVIEEENTMQRDANADNQVQVVI